MRLIASILLVFLVQISVVAQELPTRVERDSMLIGEVNSIYIRHFGALLQSDLNEIKSIKAIKLVNDSTSENAEFETYNLVVSPLLVRIDFTIWDSAQFVIPSFALDKSEQFVTPKLWVFSNFPSANTNSDIADVYEVEMEVSLFQAFMAKYWWLWEVLLFLIFLIALLLIIKIQDTISDEKPVILIAPDVLAYEELKNLLDRKLFLGEQQKLHFAEFSDILRRYIGARYNFVTFEKTTNEIVSHLKKKRVESKFIEQFGALLNLADMIKFSKATTDETEIEQAHETAKDLIRSTTLENEKQSENEGLSQSPEASRQKPVANNQSPKTEKGDGDA